MILDRSIKPKKKRKRKFQNGKRTILRDNH